MPPLLLNDEYPFFETARWCLGALKNLTRPMKLSSSSIGIGNEEQQKDAVATRAILDAGILPLLLRILKSKGYDDTGTMHSWHPNSVQDAALYILLHMTSVPQVRKLLRVDYECVDVLRSVLQYGKVVIGEKSLVKDDDDESLRLLSLQCLKAVRFCFISIYLFGLYQLVPPRAPSHSSTFFPSHILIVSVWR